jgi:hypothetical protein
MLGKLLNPGLRSPDCKNYNMPFRWMHRPRGALPVQVVPADPLWAGTG